MLDVENYAAIRHAHFVEQQSIRAIARRLHCSPKTIRKALGTAQPAPFTPKVPRVAPLLGAFKGQIDTLLAENTTLPPKQRYTGHKIFLALQAAGYAGSEASVRGYVWRHQTETRRPAIFLPLAFDPGQDAQVDWGEAEVVLGGVQQTVQVFVLRLNYSRQVFVAAYPTQAQEAFFDAHVQAFEFLGGVPARLSYDNLRVAVQRVLEGPQRTEQPSFIAFRSHYLFASHFCTPAQGHEKGGVEHGVGYARRNFFVPLPVVADFAELNAQLRTACERDAQRTVAQQARPIQAMLAEERPHLRPLPAHPFACCVTRTVALNPYGQLTYATNRYSVPAERARATLVLKAFPFRIEISDGAAVIAVHPRCYGHDQEVLEPSHYFPLLAQRPGAFDHAKPMRQLRATWPAVYEKLLQALRTREGPEAVGLREFVQILRLGTTAPAALMEQAITQALACGCPHFAGVQLCLQQLAHPTTPLSPVDLTQHPHLAALGQQPVDLQRYEQLLGSR